MGFRGGASGAGTSVHFAPPGESIDVGDTTSEGVSNRLPRADHRHAVPPPADVDVADVAAAKTAGVATAPARADHRHGHSAAMHLGGGHADLTAILGSIANRVTTGPIAAAATVDVVVPIDPALPDANYTVEASVEEATAGDTLRMRKIVSRAPNQVVVRVVNSDALNAHTGTVHVLIRHDSQNPGIPTYARVPLVGDAVVFVAATGSDANDGLSWGTAKATIAGAHAALPAGGGYIRPLAGTFVQGLVAFTKPVVVEGLGDATVLRLADATLPANGSGVMFHLTGTTSTWVFRHLVIDGNGGAQSVTAPDALQFFKAISADGNAAGGAGATLIIDDVLIRNVFLPAAAPNGLAVNTFGASTQFFRGLRTDNCDHSVFVTQPFVGDPNQTHIDGLYAKNPRVAVLTLEGFGGVVATNITGINDVAGNAAGIRVLTTNLVRQVAIQGARFHRLGYMANIGAGGTNAMVDSSLSDFVGIDCKGSFNLAQADSSCSFSGLVANGCATGGIPGATVFGSLEVGGGGASDHCHVSQVRIIGSANAGISFNGPGSIDGGEVRNSTFANVSFASPAVQAASRVRHLRGFNPQGVEGVVAGASPFTYTNNDGVPEVFYIQSGAVSEVAKNGVGIFSTTDVSVHLEPGDTCRITYTGVPNLAKDRL